MKLYSLSGTWTLHGLPADDDATPRRAECTEGEIVANVPGFVHLHLMDGHRIEDPYQGDAELRAKWIGDCAWRYERDIELAEEDLRCEHLDLVCEGLGHRRDGRAQRRASIGSCVQHAPAVSLRPQAGGTGRPRTSLTITFGAPQPLQREAAPRARGACPGSNKGIEPADVPQRFTAKDGVQLRVGLGPAARDVRGSGGSSASRRGTRRGWATCGRW